MFSLACLLTLFMHLSVVGETQSIKRQKTRQKWALKSAEVSEIAKIRNAKLLQNSGFEDPT